MHPVVYEINTRCWLRELTQARGEPVRLDNVPDEVFVGWRREEFTHLWLMGVWASGTESRATYLAHPHTAAHLREVLPDWTETDVAGSPYAIADYCVPGELGGEAGLIAFRKKLHAAGLGLMLDFVPNHLGLDHPWLVLARHPEYFIQSAHPAPGTFRRGEVWFAHGKDPYFPAWDDTVQLDHRRADTRAAVIRQLHSVASRCDAVRCDMAMLLLADVFARNWEAFPGTGPLAFSEFWAEAIAAVRRPGFLFLAEAYWDREAELQALGFDFTYDKRVLDFLVERRPAALSAHLLSKGDAFVGRSAHFLENHDEPRIASRLSFEEHHVAAWLMMALPGLRLLHEGQLSGARVRVPVHLARRPAGDADPRMARLYEHVLALVGNSAVGKGEGRLLRPEAVTAEDRTHENCVAVEWTGARPGVEWVVMNPGRETARCKLALDSRWVGAGWEFTDSLPGRTAVGEMIGDSRTSALTLELPAHGVRWLRCGRRGG